MQQAINATLKYMVAQIIYLKVMQTQAIFTLHNEKQALVFIMLLAQVYVTQRFLEVASVFVQV
jgi:hypothetical protein